LNKYLVRWLERVPIVKDYISSRESPNYQDVVELWQRSYSAKEKITLDEYILESRKLQSDLFFKNIIGGPGVYSQINLANTTIDGLFNLLRSELMRTCEAHDLIPKLGEIKLSFENLAYQLPKKFGLRLKIQLSRIPRSRIILNIWSI
jgi:hypothetical protein